MSIKSRLDRLDKNNKDYPIKYGNEEFSISINSKKELNNLLNIIAKSGTDILSRVRNTSNEYKK